MSTMNDLDLQIKEREEFYHRMAEEAVEGLKTIQAVRQQLSGGNNNQDVNEKMLMKSRNVIRFKIRSRSVNCWLRGAKKVIPTRSRTSFTSSVLTSCQMSILRITRISITAQRGLDNEFT